MTLAVLLRNGTHAAADERYILKCDNASIQVAKTPIQIPIPQQSPELFDIGIFRPSITVSRAGQPLIWNTKQLVIKPIMFHTRTG